MKDRHFLGLEKNPVFKKRFAFETVKAFYKGFVDGRIEGTEEAVEVLPIKQERKGCKSNYKIWKFIENRQKHFDDFKLIVKAVESACKKGIANRCRRHYISGYVKAFKMSSLAFQGYEVENFLDAYIIGYDSGYRDDIEDLKKNARVPVLNGRKILKILETEAKKFAYTKENVDFCLKNKYHFSQIVAFLYGCKIGYIDGYIKSYFTQASEDNYVESLITNNFGA